MGWESLAKGFMAVPDLWQEESLDKDFLNGSDVKLGSSDWRLQRMQRAYCTRDNYERGKLTSVIAKKAD